jgi:propionate CoA-transferase
VIRGSIADRRGNISVGMEPGALESFALAQAVKNCKGKVICQVKYICDGILPERRSKIPGIYVDAVVVYPWQRQTDEGEYNPSFREI